MFKGDGTGTPISIRHNEGSAIFRSPQITSEINRLKIFLKQLGCVNFFGVYNPPTTVQSLPNIPLTVPYIPVLPTVPTLFSLLNKLLQHGKAVNTDQNHNKHEPEERYF
jgi:hypothetical protein